MTRFVLARSAVYMMAAQAILVAFGYLVNFWLGRHLGIGPYGTYGIIMAVATIMNLLLAPGITQGVSKLLAENREASEAIKRGMLRFLLLFSIILGAIYFLLSGAIAGWLNDESLTAYLRVLTLMIPAYILTAAYSGYLTGTKRFAKQAWVPAVYATTRLILTIALAYFFLLKGAVLAFVGASIATMLYAMNAASSKDNGEGKQNVLTVAIRTRAAGYLLLLSLFYGMHALLTNIDLFFIKALSANGATAGYYTAASTIAKMPYFIMNTLTLLIMPVIVEAAIEGKEKIRTVISEMNRYILLLLVPATLLISLTSEHTVTLIYKSNYSPAAAPLGILAFSMALATLLVVTLTMTLATGNTALPLGLITALTLAGIVLNKALIPAYGMNGAAWAMLITFFAGAAISTAHVVARFKTYAPIKSMVRIAAASAVIYFIAANIHYTNKFLVVPEYAALFAAYAAVLIITGEVNRKDIERLKSFIPSFSRQARA